MIDQRRATRVASDLPARYQTSEILLEGWAGNLSQGGMFFVGPAIDRGVGDVRVEIALPEFSPLMLAGEVRWVEEGPVHFGMGIRFVNVARFERQLLANYLLRRTYHHSSSGSSPA
ncbi:MAG: PilZ domain-containing protein [Deltaproteobacteria bacterium]|nr:PilZ domain-containing protein [Deltaproteobacteria bacterium]